MKLDSHVFLGIDFTPRKKGDLPACSPPTKVNKYTMSEEEMCEKYGPKPEPVPKPKYNLPCQNKKLPLTQEQYQTYRQQGMKDRQIVKKIPGLSSIQLANLKKRWKM